MRRTSTSGPQDQPRKIDVVTITTFVTLLYVLTVVVFTTGVASSEHRIVCGLPEVLRAMLPLLDRCTCTFSP